MIENEFISEERARECLDIVQKFVGPDEEPVLFEPGHHTDSGWSIALSGQDGDWALRIKDAEPAWPPGVWVDAVNASCLALYLNTHATT